MHDDSVCGRRARAWAIALAWSLGGCSGSVGDLADAGDDGGGPSADAGDAGQTVTLACPATGGIELETGRHALREPCSLDGDLRLAGDAQLVADGVDLTVRGNILLEGQAALRVRDATLTVANEHPQQYRIDASDQSELALEQVQVVTRADGAVGNVYCNYTGLGESTLRVTDVELDNSTSWLLGELTDSSRLEAVRTRYVPTEIYPSEAATIRIEGPDSNSGVWLLFPPGARGDLGAIPPAPLTYSFGRDTPGVENIDFQVDIVDSFVGVSVLSAPMSSVTIRDNATPMTIGYMFAGVSAPERLSNLPTGTVTTTLTNQGRSLVLDNVPLSPHPWQIYIDNAGVDSPALVTLEDSTINELAALANGRALVNRVTFQWAVLSAERASADIEIHASIINSQLIKAVPDGVVRIFDSSIWGALVQPLGTGRIILVNTSLNDNVCHPGCSPYCTTGGPCNPYNPSTSTTLSPVDGGVILGSRIAPPPATVKVGTSLSIAGDAFAHGLAGPGATYTLAYRREPSTDFQPLVTGGQTPKRDQVLGTLNTTGFATGTYTLALVVMAPGEGPVIATRQFALVP